MTKEIEYSDIFECWRCGNKANMVVVSSNVVSERQTDHNGYSWESGEIYEVTKCPRCETLSLSTSTWHDGMESRSDAKFSLIFPTIANEISALENNKADMSFMEMCVGEAAKSRKKYFEANQNGSSTAKIVPFVGAVITRNNQLIGTGFRSELKDGEHAEYTALEKKYSEEELAGATVYTTLEPCTQRGEGKIPCVDRLISRKVSRVVIGMLDPNENIRGKGVLALRHANIHVDLFPPHLMQKLEELNREFIHSHGGKTAQAAQSQNQNQEGRGGPGGKVMMFANKIEGKANISAKGGDGTIAGEGGEVLLHADELDNDASDINVDGGKQTT